MLLAPWASCLRSHWQPETPSNTTACLQRRDQPLLRWECIWILFLGWDSISIKQTAVSAEIMNCEIHANKPSLVGFITLFQDDLQGTAAYVLDVLCIHRLRYWGSAVLDSQQHLTNICSCLLCMKPNHMSNEAWLSNSMIGPDIHILDLEDPFISLYVWAWTAWWHNTRMSLHHFAD